jgi:membrane-associated protease RseP (regulator of RpoE activity)
VNDPGATPDLVPFSSRPPGDTDMSGRGAALSVRHHSEGTGDEEHSRRGSLFQLLFVVGVIVLLALAAHAADLLIVIVAIVAMIMIHELGHFATAKWSGMKVTEYFLGFGPRLWSFRRGETEYGVKAFPLGGYVKILGMSNTEEVDPADEPRTYRQKPFHNRLMVALAGSFMHFVMAFVLIWYLFTFVGVTQPTTTVAGFVPVAHGVDPARAAGIRTGDRIISIDGRAITSTDQLQRIVGHNAGVALTVLVERGKTDRLHTFTVTPLHPSGSPTSPALMGVELGVASVPVFPLHALGSAAAEVGHITTGTLSILGQTFSPHGLSSFFSQLGNNKAAAAAAAKDNRPVSIYGAVHLALQGAQGGMADLLSVLVTIIIAVGIVNLFPMLPLDGGHVLVAVYERIRSRKGKPYHADVTKLIPVASAFVLFLVVFVAAAVFLDITHPIANPFQ